MVGLVGVIMVTVGVAAAMLARLSGGLGKNHRGVVAAIRSCGPLVFCSCAVLNELLGNTSWSRQEATTGRQVRRSQESRVVKAMRDASACGIRLRVASCFRIPCGPV